MTDKKKGRPPLRVFKDKAFVKFANKEGINDETLLEAVNAAENGLIAADLGGGVIKQRIARPGEGKSGGYRTIIIFRRGDRAFFMFGFPKSERENITQTEKNAFKEVAPALLGLSDDALTNAIENGLFTEIKIHGTTEAKDDTSEQGSTDGKA